MMFSRSLFALLLLVAAVPNGMARDTAAAPSPPLHEATTPAHKNGTGWWKQRHKQKLDAAKTAKCEILFVGDSITHMWESRSGDLWKENYVKRNAFNIGYSGDQTQHVLWRLDNGELASFQPKVAVVMIGTNNAHRQPNWTAQKVADGVQAIVGRIQKHSPDTHVLVLGIFPRGATPQDPMRLKNDQTNALISQLDDGKNVHYLDISSALLESDGTLSKKVMPDLLHPNAHGYKLWADAMEPTLKKLLQQSKAPGAAVNSAVVPVPKLEDDFYDWYQRHDAVKELAKKKMLI